MSYPKDFLSIADFTKDQITGLIDLAADLKRKQKDGRGEPLLKGRVLAMIFHKPSLRTRVSFETAMIQAGGSALYITEKEIGRGEREPMQDIARVLSRYVDAIMIRTFGHDIAETLARHATVPVINGLTDALHPCQILGDLLTIREHRKTLDGLKVAYIGDGNNVAASWINACAALDFTLAVAAPDGFKPQGPLYDRAKARAGSRLIVTGDPREAVKDAHIVYTDVWASMGQESEAESRRKAFAGFIVDEALMAAAAPDAKAMHCLPAHRGDEISDGVMEGKASIVFDQAENRLHIQKAILVRLMNRGT